MKGIRRKLLLAIGLVPLFFLLNKYYLKEKNFSKTHKTYKSKPDKKIVVVIEPASSARSEIRTLVKKVAKRSSEAELMNKIHDFSKQVKEIIPSLDKGWQEEGKGLIKSLEECQSKDFCDMRPDEDGYFDESETHARKSQVRLLDLLNQAYSENKDESFLLATATLEDLLESGNDKIVNGVVKQLLAKGELGNFIERLSGHGRSDALVLISKTDISITKMLNLIEASLGIADPYTVVLVFENLEKMKFNEVGFKAIIKRVCHLKNGMPQNWKPILAISKRIANKRGYTTNAKKTCQ